MISSIQLGLIPKFGTTFRFVSAHQLENSLEARTCRKKRGSRARTREAGPPWNISSSVYTSNNVLSTDAVGCLLLRIGSSKGKARTLHLNPAAWEGMADLKKTIERDIKHHGRQRAYILGGNANQNLSRQLYESIKEALTDFKIPFTTFFGLTKGLKCPTTPFWDESRGERRFDMKTSLLHCPQFSKGTAFIGIKHHVHPNILESNCPIDPKLFDPPRTPLNKVSANRHAVTDVEITPRNWRDFFRILIY